MPAEGRLGSRSNPLRKKKGGEVNFLMVPPGGPNNDGVRALFTHQWVNMHNLRFLRDLLSGFVTRKVCTDGTGGATGRSGILFAKKNVLDRHGNVLITGKTRKPTKHAKNMKTAQTAAVDAMSRSRASEVIGATDTRWFSLIKAIIYLVSEQTEREFKAAGDSLGSSLLHQRDELHLAELDLEFARADVVFGAETATQRAAIKACKAVVKCLDETVADTERAISEPVSLASTGMCCTRLLRG